MGVDLLNMRYIAGVDGTKKGWAVALAEAYHQDTACPQVDGGLHVEMAYPISLC